MRAGVLPRIRDSFTTQHSHPSSAASLPKPYRSRHAVLSKLIMAHVGEKQVDHVDHPVERADDTPSVRSGDTNGNDNKAHAAHVTEAQQVADTWVDGTVEEKRLVRKLDWRILPCTWVLYLLGFLDRANIGCVGAAFFLFAPSSETQTD